MWVARSTHGGDKEEDEFWASQMPHVWGELVTVTP